MKETIQQKIVNYLSPVSEGIIAAEVRIGLGYTSVRLDNGNAGLAWTAHSRSGSCTYEARAGTLGGTSARELLELLASADDSLSRTIGLATANALAAGIVRPKTTQVNVLDLVDIQATDHVVMVGFFGPLVSRIQRTGCHLDILELNRERQGTLAPEEGQMALAACSVAIITATSIITGTFDELLSVLGKSRAAILLGPSTLMCPEVYKGTPLTHIAGSWIRNASAVERIVSEGGGTMILKQYMDFETIVM